MTFIELLRSHIKTPFITAFAYGSGVFKQESRITGNKMIDYLVVVEDNKLTKWHESNCKVNPGDYTFLGKVALSKSKLFDESVYYVPNVKVSGDKKIKYGVLGWGTLIKDLFTWESMFLAGRLQKPTIRYDIEVDEEKRDVLNKAMEYNLDSALITSILLNHKNSNDFKNILKGIVSLSYTNDPRMMLAESPQKIDDIIKGQLNELELMYINRYEKLISHGSFSDKMRMIYNLPLNLKKEMIIESIDEKIIKEAVGRIVKRSAWKQMILGFISTPLNKTIIYSLDKVKKRFS